MIAVNWQNIINPNPYVAGPYFDDACAILKPGTTNSKVKEMLNAILENTTLSFDPESFKCAYIEKLENTSFPFLDVAI